MTEQHTQGRIRAIGVDLVVGDLPVLGASGWATTAGLSQAECEANAAELVRRWNAFEPGGAVERFMEAVSAVQPPDTLRHSYECDGVGDFCGCLWGNVRATYAALVEPGAGAGKEPQG